ncbi:MAG: PAS domain-containing protein, partial [Salinibacter sp.]|uniref:PAS domain-containing protein n=1 Tax=Salinibacter sp. TaxID=2065818 RepID=UPI0035D46A87
PHPASPTSQSDVGTGSKDDDPSHAPVLTLDRGGTIQHLAEPARRVLEYPPDATPDPCFFSHVHGRNLRRVMRDLARMVSHRKQRARWLLRLRTGNGRWRWYRCVARNHLDQPDGAIQVRLRPL